MPIGTREITYKNVLVDCDHCEARLCDPRIEFDDFPDMAAARKEARRQRWVITDDQQHVICPADDAEHHDAIDRVS